MSEPLMQSCGAKRGDDFEGVPASSDTPRGWYSEVVNRLILLTGLPGGWDGHGGKPTAPASAFYALEVLGRIMEPGLPLPSIMPLSNGGLQLEWHRRGWDVEVEIFGGPKVEVFVHNLATGEDEELTVDTDLSRLGAVTARIKD